MTSTSPPPPPLEWHPAYRCHAWLIDWVNRGPGYEMRVPVPTKVTWDLSPDLVDQVRVMRISRRECIGMGVWVGEPYMWRWWAGVDEVGRCIAGESRRVATPYLDPEYLAARMEDLT